MSDSPKSEFYDVRYGTPVLELDDHRNQPESLPRTEAMEAMVAADRSRRETRRSTVGEQPGMLSVRDAFQHAANARDFEYAIDDDDHTPGRSNSRHATSAPQSPNIAARHQPMSPIITARQDNNFRRPKIIEERPEGDSASIHSARSISPPHSVEAFAEKGNHRGRAGTATSISPSFITHRSPNIAPRERRPTFGSVGNIKIDDDSSSQGSVEDDVCFPTVAQSAGPQRAGRDADPLDIDYDELEDFVAKYKHNPISSSVPEPFSRRGSVKVHEPRLKIFQNMTTPKMDCDKTGIPCKSVRNGATARDDSSDSIMDEKLGAKDSGATLKGDDLADPINRWSFFSSSLEEIIHAPDLGDLLMPGESFQHLFDPPEKDRGGVWWLDMLMPSEDEVEAICKAFGIHGLTREDIIQQETREKVELFKSYYFVCFRSFYQMDPDHDCYLEPVNVYAVVFREGILTFTFCPSPHAANVRKRMGKLLDYVSLGADWICYALIDDIVDSYGPVIREIEHQTECIEDNVFIAREGDSVQVLQQIGECRKVVMSVARLLGGKADVIKGFAKRCNEQYSIAPRQDVGLYLSDIQDHVITMMSNLSHFEKMLSRSHANYLAHISLESIAQGNRSNQVLGKITFIATILVPVNLIFGMFSMNVQVPGKDSTSLGWFGGILGVVVAFVLIAFITAKKYRVF